MATSVVQIVNNALVRIGANSITALTENSEAARAANVIYEQVRDATIRDHVWNFAVKRVQLAQDTETPAFEYSYQYALPSDCLRVLQMQEKTMVYKIEGRKLLTDEGTAIGLYEIQQLLFQNCHFASVANGRWQRQAMHQQPICRISA